MYWACRVFNSSPFGASQLFLPLHDQLTKSDKLLTQTQEKPRTCFSASREFQCRSSSESNTVMFHQTPHVYRSHDRMWTFVTVRNPETENCHWVLKDIKESAPESDLWRQADPQQENYIRLRKEERLQTRCRRTVYWVTEAFFSMSTAVTQTKGEKGWREMQIKNGSVSVFSSCLWREKSQGVCWRH